MSNQCYLKRVTIPLLAITCWTAPGSPANGSEHPGGLHTIAKREAIRTKLSDGIEPWNSAWVELRQSAREALNRSPGPMLDFKVPGYYKDEAAHIEARGRLSEDSTAAYLCAVASNFAEAPERELFASKAIEILDAWASINTKTSDNDGDLVMAYAGVGFILAAEWLLGADEWPEEQEQRFRNWVALTFLPACSQIADDPHNWGAWGTFGSIAANHFLDRKEALQADTMRLRKFIDHHIAADGSLPAEVRRGKQGTWYTYFALAPLTAACTIVDNSSDVDLFQYHGEDGAGIETALSYYFQFCQDPQEWPHYTKSDLRSPSPGDWPGNLFEAMHQIYPDLGFDRWVEGSRPIMRTRHHHAWSFPTLLDHTP